MRNLWGRRRLVVTLVVVVVCCCAVVLALALPSVLNRRGPAKVSSATGSEGAHRGGLAAGTTTVPNTDVPGAGVPTTGSARAGRAPRDLAGTAVDPKLFLPGSCVRYPPTDGDRHLTVFLDAGHGGIDPGATGYTETGKTIYEAQITLPVELDAARMLRAEGFSVVVSRTRDSLVGRPGPQSISGGLLTPQGVHDDVAARDKCANLARADALVGIYFDAGYSSLNAGCLTAYDRDRKFWPSSLRLADLVQKDVLSSLNTHGWGIPNDGVTPDSTLGGPPLDEASADYGHLLLLGPEDPGWFTHPSRMPGALIEPLYITDPFEGSIAASTSGQEAMASGISRAVEQYFASPGSGLPPRSAAAVPVPQPRPAGITRPGAHRGLRSGEH